MIRGAAAVFVKTPGATPLKTRLAKGIGEAAALAFYELSCAAIREVLETVDGGGRYQLTPHWAVAEREAAPRWSSLPTVWQGEGDLGDRLATVYGDLLERFDFVALLGADAPQLCAEELDSAITKARDGSFVMGPADDGGFYLLVGSKPVARELWRSVPYSHESTGAALSEQLNGLAPVSRVVTKNDVDTAADLPALATALSNLPRPTPAQRELKLWLARLGHGR